tara:strand:- start:902 stop:1840 length:939 start_codon:yes stop_codon:yes gene_type:complete
MKQILLSMTVLFAMSVNAQITNCTELFISEYVEGSYNNKALEIYNPTTSSIDLSEYIVIRYSNGSNSASSIYAIQLVGIIPANDVHVGVVDKRDPNGLANETPVADSLQAKADAFYCPVYNINKTWYWNGNDAVVLAKGSVNDILNAEIIDVFGKIGESDIANGGGWTNIASASFVSTGYSWTEDHTLKRKSSVLSGDINALDLFNVGLEWDSLAEDTWINLGSHECDCANSTTIDEMNGASYTLYPNPVNKGETISVKSDEIIKNITVINILGEQVRFNNSISTAALSKGIYIVDIDFSKGKRSRDKFIIK